MADICVSYPKCAHQVLRLLQQLHNVKFLTLSLEIVELLSSSVELMSYQPSPFANLKRLKIHPERDDLPEFGEPERVKMSAEVRGYLLDSSPGATFTMASRELLSSSVELLSNQPSPFANLKSLMIHPGQLIRSRERVKMPAEVRGYLLDSSPGATFTVYSHEYIRAMYNTNLAQNHIKKLRTFLEKEKAATETKMAKIHEQGKAHIDIDTSLKDLSVQIKKGKEKASVIISLLKDINQVLTKLPAPNRATIQPSFSTLHAEADIVMKKNYRLYKDGFTSS